MPGGGLAPCAGAPGLSLRPLSRERIQSSAAWVRPSCSRGAGEPAGGGSSHVSVPALPCTCAPAPYDKTRPLYTRSKCIARSKVDSKELTAPHVGSGEGDRGAAAVVAREGGAARADGPQEDAGGAAWAAQGRVQEREREREKIDIFESVDLASTSQRSWNIMVRWGKALRAQEEALADSFFDRLEKVVVFGGGSFGTAMASSLAKKVPSLRVVCLLRDAELCRDINERHCNTRYLSDFTLPPNVSATTSPKDAIEGAQLAIHAVPVQHSRAFLQGISALVPPDLPIVCLSKGLEVESGLTMADVIPSALGRKQPCAFLSGPSFAREVMEMRPTALVVASRDRALIRRAQRLFSSPYMRVSSTTDVTGVEIAGALKNVLAIAAGIVDGMGLGLNATAAVTAQGTMEIRWLAERMGAKAATVSGISGLGDIMLTCYGSLSRNRSVGLRLGRGEALDDILGSMSQVAEGVATARVVVKLAYEYRVQLPVLTAVAQILDGHVTPREAMLAIMDLPQIEER